MTALAELQLDEGQFLDLLGKLIGESKYLQNNPPELVPVEDRGELTGSRPVLNTHCSQQTTQAMLEKAGEKLSRE